MWRFLIILTISCINCQVYDKSDYSNCTCVPYYQCSDDSGYLITDGTGLFDVRGYKAIRCSGYFDVCCKVSSTPVPTETPPLQKGCGYLKSKSFPWSGALLHKELSTKQPSVYKCGVTLIHDQAVVTAAHCMNPTTGIWAIRIGHVIKEVSHIYLHPKFSSGTLQNDLAVLILDSPIATSENVRLVCLPPPGTALEKTWCSISDNDPDHSRSLNVPIVQRDKCQMKLRNTRLGRFFNLHASFICAGGDERRKTCDGDGGNPLICPIPGQPGRYQQVGIVSWGIGCGEHDTPGVYVNLPLFRDWIDEVMIANGLNINSYRY